MHPGGCTSYDLCPCPTLHTIGQLSEGNHTPHLKINPLQESKGGTLLCFHSSLAVLSSRGTRASRPTLVASPCALEKVTTVCSKMRTRTQNRRRLPPQGRGAVAADTGCDERRCPLGAPGSLADTLQASSPTGSQLFHLTSQHSGSSPVESLSSRPRHNRGQQVIEDSAGKGAVHLHRRL